MFHFKESLRLTAGLLSCTLVACGSLSRMWSGGEPIQVTEVRRLTVCNSDGPQPRVSLFADREAVRSWQRAHQVELIGVDPLPQAGAYALVEMGVHPSGGYGVLVSRQAVASDGVARLSATVLAPAAGQQGRQMATSPCVLVALPEGVYRGVEVRDPSGELLARADAAAPVQ